MLLEMVEKIINKRQEVRGILVNKLMGDESTITQMTDDEFKFMKAYLELERMTDDLIGTINTKLSKLQNEVDVLKLERAK